MKAAKIFAGLGRVFLALAGLALAAAWASELTRAPVFGLSQQHLYNDGTVLALMAIALLVDAQVHRSEAR